MSAILGIFYRDGKAVDRSDLGRMLDKLAHRGPDAAAIWADSNIGLGHRMLWTTPESLQERLPLVDGVASMSITAAARIDNREELLRLLDCGDRPGKLISDSELILSAYQKWGEHCVERLFGDFVFAIWDTRQQTLFCARDRFGVKPFYYYSSGDVFAFASEIKALTCLSEIPRSLNEKQVADYLLQNFEDPSITFYEGISRLPAAHSIVIGREKTRVQRYWSLDPSRELQLRSDGDYAEAFREIFDEAVRCRLRSAFPVGTTLSGGMDSSSIACTARNLLRERDQELHTFSAIFPSLPERELRAADERQYIDAVISHGGFNPFYLRADLLSPLEEFSKVMWHQDEVSGVPNLYMHWGLYRAAQHRNVRVFLDGFDGDTVVSHGLEYLMQLFWKGHWASLFSEAKALSKVSNSSYTTRRIIWEFGIRPRVPQGPVNAWNKLTQRSKQNAIGNGILNEDFVAQKEIAARIKNSENQNTKAASTARESHFNELNSGLHCYTLELADKAASAFQLEPRYPFYDHRLAEFCLALPASQRLHNGQTRAIMHRAMANVLPDKVNNRTNKANLSSNFCRNFLHYEKKLIDKLLNDARSIEKYVDLGTLRAAYDRYISQPMRNGKDAITVYRALVLAIWLQDVGFDRKDNKKASCNIMTSAIDNPILRTSVVSS